MVTARRSAAALTALALVVVGLSACKGGGGGGSGASGLKAGAPIHLMVDAVLTGGAATGGVAFPSSVNGAKAAADDLNKTGGIDGHKVVIDGCDNKADPNGGAVCARTAKQNGDIAVVGSFDVTGASNTVPILQKEGIPYIGALASSQVELSNPDSFQFDGGLALGGFALLAEEKTLGCTSIVDFSPGGPDAALDPVVQGIAIKAGFKYKVIQAPPTAPDVAPFISQALAVHPDCLVATGPGAEDVKLIATTRKTGSNIKFVTAVGALLPPLLASLGSAGTNIYADNTTLLPNSTDPLVTQFRNDIFAAEGTKAGVGDLNEFAQDGWSAVMLVKQALTGVSSISASSLVTALNKDSNATPGNAYDPVNFTQPRNSKLYPRLFNAQVRFYEAKNGQYVDYDDQWHDASQFVP